MAKRFLMVGVAMLILGVSFGLVGRLFSESEVILAKVGDTVITQRDFDEFLRRNAFARRNKPYTPEEKKIMLDNLIKSVAVIMEAEKEKFDETPEFKSRMKLYRLELLVQDYFANKIQPTVSVTDEELDEVMKSHPALLPKETLQLKEILVKTEKEAEAISDQLKKGADFGTIAAEKSISESRVNGGFVKTITRGMLPKAAEEAVFGLKKGELSKPIKTERGFYIFYLVDRKEKTPEEMAKLTAQVREKVKQIEISKKAQDIYQKKAEELKSKMKVEIYYDRIQN